MKYLYAFIIIININHFKLAYLVRLHNQSNWIKREKLSKWFSKDQNQSGLREILKRKADE